MNKVQGAIARSLWTQDTATPLNALTRQGSTVELAGQFFIHTKQVTDLTTTYTDITGRHVDIRTNHLI